MLQLSIYTHLFRRNHSFYIYNSMHSYFAEISEDLYEILYNRDFHILPNNLATNLIKIGVLVPHEDQYNFYYESALKFYTTSYNPSSLGLILVPTTSCNFSCPYCFEGKKQGAIMSDEIHNKIIELIKGQENLKDINLTWYGGEPLLAFPRIQKLYHDIKCIESTSIHSHSIVTNGYLITPEIIDFFRESRLNHIQITLDGTREHHNDTRALQGSKLPTYDHILDNIALICNAKLNCNISIRININKHNMHDYISVQDELNRKLSPHKLHIYPGIIREDTTDKCSMCYSCIDHNDYFDLLQACECHGLKIRYIPKVVLHKGCMANSLNAFIIGPNGEIYKCWNDVNHPERVIGNIQHCNFTNKRLYLNYQLLTSPFTRDECKNCLVFPACSGGCGHLVSRNLLSEGKYNVCPIFKDTHMLEDILVKSLHNDQSDPDDYDLSL